MIEVNLLPGGKKRRRSKGGRGGGGGFLQKLSLPSLRATDAYSIAAVVAQVGVLGTIGWGYFALSAGQEDRQVALADALQDSSNYADLIEHNATLAARRDSIAEKVNIIQEIDALRFVWPHLLDEVARALPDYTWLTQVTQVSVGEVIEFQVHGRAGNNLALTTFMRTLQESLFVRSVSLVQTEQVFEPNGQTVQVFQLNCVYQTPPVEFLETVSLFGDELAAINQ